MGKKVAILAVFLLAIASFGLAQQVNAKLFGVVSDSEGNPLPGVSVIATSPKMVGQATAVSDSTGTFRLMGLVPGTYKVVFSLQGFQTLVREGIIVSLEQTITLHETLQVGTLAEQITVVGKSPLIDVKSTVKGMTMTKEVFDNLPKGRDFDSLITAIPGVSNESIIGGTSVDGASGLENVYYIDGTDVTDIVYGDRAQGAAFEFVDEVQVKASGYQAEFGGSLGGVVSVITRSGGNEFHGEVVGYYSGSPLRDKYRETLELNLADDSVATYYPYEVLTGRNRDNRFEVGASLGGYIIKDKLWFFGSFLPVFYGNTRTVNYTSDGVTVDATRDWFRRQTNINFNAKLTSQPFKNVRLSASFVNNWYEYKGDLSNAYGDPNPTVSYDDYGFTYPNYSASATADITLTNNLFVSLRGGYFMTNQNNQLVAPTTPCFQFLTEAPGGYFRTTNIGLVGLDGTPVPVEYQRPTGYYNYARANSPVVNKSLNEKYSVNADLTYYLTAGGEHAFKIGAQWVRQGQNYDATANYPVLFFGWNRDFVAYSVNYGRGNYGYYGVRGNDVTGPYGDFYDAYSNRWALYIQDSWTIKDRFTINLGLRTESEYIPSYATGNPEFENIKAVKFGFGDKLAPRFGFVYDVFGDSTLKVFGSLGWFYDVMKLQMAAGSYGGFKWKSTYYKLDTYEWDKIGVDGYFPGDFLLPAPYTFDFRPVSFDSTDPGMKPMSMREISLGVEKKLMTDLSVSLRFVNKHLLWAIEDIGVLLPEGEFYYTTNPGGAFIKEKYAAARAAGLIPANAPDCPKATRNYYGVNFAVDKRFSNAWMAGFSYTWSRLWGNYNGLASGDEYGRTDPNTERYFDLWYLAFDRNLKPVDGVLPGDRTHYFKAYGSYTLPFGLTAGLIVNAYSGLATSTEWALDVQGYLPNGRNDLGRSPFTLFANAYLAYQFKVGKNSFEVNLNVDNVTNTKTAQRIYAIYNQGTVTVPEDVIASGSGWDINDYSPVLDPRFKQKMNFYGPISARVGLRFSF
ncbi:MAG: TonB-dependent receptor [Acidobacteriota bacterium]